MPSEVKNRNVLVHVVTEENCVVCSLLREEERDPTRPVVQLTLGICVGLICDEIPLCKHHAEGVRLGLEAEGALERVLVVGGRGERLDS